MAPSTLDIPAQPVLGTSHTTAPIAELPHEPRSMMKAELARELKLFQASKSIVEWITDQLAVNNAGPYLFTAIEAALNALLQPNLQSALDLLIFYGTLTRQIDEYTPVINNTTNSLEVATLTAAQAGITQFTDDFVIRANKLNPRLPVHQTAMIPPEWCSNIRQAIVEERRLERLQAPGLTDEAKAAIELELANIRIARTFEQGVVALLTRFHAINGNWVAGNYVQHDWAEFSADVFLKSGLNAERFYLRDNARQFFDDLNTACELEDATDGKFAWQAIYNDPVIFNEMSAKYGANRILQRPGHGPDVNGNIHIHLNFRPVQLEHDALTGYHIVQERIVLF